MTPETRAPRDREHDDPEEQVRPLPRVLLALAFSGGLWGGWYLARSESDVSPLLGDRRSAAAFAAPPANAAVDGAQVFTGKCAACHQASGLGLPGVFPPLARSPWVSGSKERLLAILLHGVQGPIEVLGITYNGMMPAWNALSDAELAAVSTYVRKAFGNTGSAITVGDVVAARTATAARTSPWAGGEELERVP